MDYRFYNRDLDFLDKEDFEFSVLELKKKFGIEVSEGKGRDDTSSQDDAFDEVLSENEVRGPLPAYDMSKGCEERECSKEEFESLGTKK